jgi:hypothetical protein
VEDVEVSKTRVTKDAFMICACFIWSILAVLIALFIPIEAKGASSVSPYEIPTFTGEKVEWGKIKPAINPLPTIDGDYLQGIVTNCYPEKPWSIELSAKAGIQYRKTIEGEITTSDSSPYYAGIVFNMPLYSGSEVDMMRNREYKRRIATAGTISELIKAVALKRRAQRMMGLYLSLEKRSQARVKNGIVSVNEQIMYLEKVANTQAELDQANASIEGSRISLVAQCRPEVAEDVNNIILSEIYPESSPR